VERAMEGATGGPISSRTRRAAQTKPVPSNQAGRYETPNEEEELLNEVLASAHRAAKKLDNPKSLPRQAQGESGPAASYLTPSPSANCNSGFGQNIHVTPSQPMQIAKPQHSNSQSVSKWPTPPYDDNDWATSVAASLLATQSLYR
jgi:meiosis induction protein kinase IME2/SME1